MRVQKILFFFLTGLLSNCVSNHESQVRPPLAPVKPVNDVYFGKRVSDPYRYMENLEDTAVQRWLKQQSDYTRGILDRISGRDELTQKMEELDKRKTSQITNLVITDNDIYFYLKTTPEDETGKLFYREGFNGSENLLFDPVKYSADTSQKYVITSLAPALDGSKVAFDIAPNGSENSVLLSIDVTDRKLYPERIDRHWGPPPSWMRDNKSFLFTRISATDVHDKSRALNSRVYLHLTGTDTSKDIEIFSREKNPQLGIKPEDLPMVFYDKNSNYVFGILGNADRRLHIFYAPALAVGKQVITWKLLSRPTDEVYDYAASDSNLYLYTAKGAQNFKIIKLSLKNPDLNAARVIVPENKEAKLVSMALTSDGLYYTQSKNGVAEKLFFVASDNSKHREIKTPFAAGTITLSTKGATYSDVWATISSWANDYRRYRYIPAKNEFVPEDLSPTAAYPEYADLTVEELMVRSHDGVEVPLSLVYKKSLHKDSKRPVLLYGFGAYGASLNPLFHPEFLIWTLKGGVIAFAHVRGGGDLGSKWHDAGFKTTKPNSWKDFIACAEFLIKEKYTSAEKIAINGGSAGGVLIGRAMTERPDLFAVAIPEVGCLNPVRQEESPNGPLNVPEFGSVKDSVECMALIEMDSYLHVKDGTKYPATLVTAGMNDPRVIAWQPAKFAARLQAANTSGKPILLSVEYKSGHGIGNTKAKFFENLADVLSFALWQTGHQEFILE